MQTNIPATWHSASNRERLMRALQATLREIPGVRTVARQAITDDLVPDTGLPAIVIEETGTQYRWGGTTRRRASDRHVGRTMSAETVCVLDLQVLCATGAAVQTHDDPYGNVSAVREAFVWEVINTLVHDANLRRQLADEDEPQAHCNDCALSFQVSYENDLAAYPYARAMIVVTLDFSETFDDRPRPTFNALILELGVPVPPLAEEITDTPGPITVELDNG